MSALAILLPRRLARLFRADSLNVSRDPTLIFATLMSFVPAPAFVFFHDRLEQFGQTFLGLAGIADGVGAMALILPAFLIGWVTGFLMLEDRDDGPLLAIEVTPPGKAGLLIYRVLVTFALSALVSLVATPLILPESSWHLRLLLVCLVGFEAIASAMILAAIARNKVEGLALTKLTNLASLFPLLAIPATPLRYLGFFMPPFWIGELLGLGTGARPDLWVVALLAIAIHLIVVFLLYRLTIRRAG